MDNKHIFHFKSDISELEIPNRLNNPFGTYIPEIAKVAAKEFQAFITQEAVIWNYNFHVQKGKMWGVLVVQQKDGTYAFLGAISGKIPGNAKCDRLIPSIFDESVGDFFINKGMTSLTEIGTQIKNADCPSEITALKEKRRQKSVKLQRRLFDNYNFLNLSGKEENLLEIFSRSTHKNPPVAAGECAAPKLLQYAIQHDLKPIALTEFWWGSSIANKEKEHASFYPACKNRCRPILEYMLEDSTLFEGQGQFISEMKL